MEGILDYRVLDREVLAVAVEGAVKDWAVYIGAVPGENHDEEMHIVARSGSKAPESLAKFLFPAVRGLTYRG